MGAGLGRCLSVKSCTTLPSIREKELELSSTAFVHGERKTIGREKGRKGRLGSLSVLSSFLPECIYIYIYGWSGTLFLVVECVP